MTHIAIRALDACIPAALRNMRFDNLRFISSISVHLSADRAPGSPPKPHFDASGGTRIKTDGNGGRP